MSDATVINFQIRAVQFFVHGLPKGQPRARAFARKFGNKVSARMYDPGTADDWKECVALAAKEHLKGTVFDRPVQVGVQFFFPRPKAHFRGARKRTDAPFHHTNKPDCDNLAKLCLDVLTTVGAWADDALVSGLYVLKTYSDGEISGAQILIRELEVL